MGGLERIKDGSHGPGAEELVAEAAEVGYRHGYGVSLEFRFGKRIWQAGRIIDVVYTNHDGLAVLGVECKFQQYAGSAWERSYATIADMATWPFPGILVFDGDGFGEGRAAALSATGRAVHISDLHSFVERVFGQVGGI